MKLSVALFFAGLFGALAVVFALLSFGTDYWLLASETYPGIDTPIGIEDFHLKHGDVLCKNGTFYHEGFFWRCSFCGEVEENHMWKFWFTNQPHSKVCMPSYLFPFPVSEQTHNSSSYQSAIIYRSFWSIFMLLAVAAIVLGGFLIICAAPFASHQLYKAGGCLFLISGFFLLSVTVMFVIWLQVLDVVQQYKDHRHSTFGSTFTLSVGYGFSFMFAPVSVFFCLLAGLLFFAVGRSLQRWTSKPL